MKKVLIIAPFLLTIFWLTIRFLALPRGGEVTYLEPTFGFSFSPRQAGYLGLDPRETYLAALDDLRPSFIRVPVFWSEVQKEKDGFDFSEIDWLLDEAKKRGVLVTVNLGYGLFRYPECDEPRWTWDLEGQGFDKALLTFLEKSVAHLANFANIEAWQVENEPELWLNKPQCRVIKNRLFLREIEVIRQGDYLGRPIVVTHGGKTVFPFLWRNRVLAGDVFAVSFFPKAYNPRLRSDTNNLWFRNIPMERATAEASGRRFWISEFQAEAWGRTSLSKMTPEEARKTMSPEILSRNLELLKEQGGAERVYLWGVEWWYRERLEGRNEMWEAGKSLLSKPGDKIKG